MQSLVSQQTCNDEVGDDDAGFNLAEGLALVLLFY